MIELTALAGFVATTAATYGINNGLDWKIENSKSKFESKLEKVIYNTIETYSKENHIPEVDGKFPFYHSQIFLNELFMHRFFSDLGYQTDKEKIAALLAENPNVITPEEKQIQAFLELFEENIKSDKNLKRIAIKDNYQNEIFEISKKIVNVFPILEEIKSNTKKIIKKIDDLNIGQSNSFPKELTSLVKIPKKDIVGRSGDLEKLRKSLVENNDTALINGMGGIGKTTLAAVYVDEFYSEYDHIAWLTIENNLEEAILANTLLIRNLKLDRRDPRNQVAECLNELCNIQSDKPKLLVIDNAHDSLAKHYNLLPKKPNWHLLVTSRERITSFKIMDLDFLPKDDAKGLYKKYHQGFSDEEVKEIVKGVEYHTLTIEILAKSANRNKWSLEAVTKALSSDAKASVNVKHNSKEKIERIKSYLTSIFDISQLSEKETYLLKQFTALPNQFIELGLFSELLQRDELDWKDDFFATLENLYDKGFILKDIDDEDKTESYKMHPVLVEAIIEILKVTFDDLKLLLKSATKLLQIDYSIDNPIDKFQFVPFGEILLKVFSTDNYSEITILENNLAVVYQALGNFDKAKELLENALESDIRNFGESHPSVSVRKSNLGLLYNDLGEYERARELLEKAIDSDLKTYDESHPSIAVHLSNLGTVLLQLKEFEKAKELFNRALKSEKANFGNDHPNVARCQSNLALAYRNLGNIERARELLGSSLQSDINNFGNNHPTVAVRMSNLAIIYIDLEDFEKAIDLFERAIKSGITNFGKNHPNVAIDQNNLATVYHSLGEINKSIELWNKSYNIFLTAFGEEHPSTKTVKKYLDDCGVK